ncbi:heat shock factor 2-binding protein isoform X5 [Mesocricetus auratus]|uniref:Heat shock factor 2-binding protein isoform X5 n=1 Tax=Mesocricetus auratus TaxID=10036 RepID=A0ABM2WHV5_MESAU|nr:heat shock factor 2-binding protein isoform X5 [Mesocricetus auratus]
MAASGGEVAAMGEGSGIEEAFRYIESKEEFVKVRKKDLERLTTEVMQLRDFLPRLLNAELMESFQKLNVVEKNLERKEQELEQLRLDCEHFKARLETVQADSGREKKDKALKFFNITGQTMESYVKSLDGDVKEVDSDENQFVFALAGIVTNVAAMACGREFLVNSSRVLLDTMLQLLGDLKPGQCTKLKVLMLMSLYNVSINSKGLKYISESPGFIPLLWWLLSAPVYTPHLLCPTWPCPVRSSHSAITRSKWLPRTNFRTQHHPSRSSTVVWTLVPSIFLALGKNFSPSCQLQV